MKFKLLKLSVLLLSLNVTAQITSTNGLENLESIEGDLIISNTQLTNVDGLTSLINVSGDVIIKNNSSLASYCGLKNLFENGVIGGEVIIEGNEEDLDPANLNFSSCASLSVSDEFLENNIFYPNPVTDHITISDVENVQSVFIYNVLGRLILSKDNDFSTINVSNLLKGYYTLVILDTSNKRTVTKLIKQ